MSNARRASGASALPAAFLLLAALPSARAQAPPTPTPASPAPVASAGPVTDPATPRESPQKPLRYAVKVIKLPPDTNFLQVKSLNDAGDAVGEIGLIDGDTVHGFLWRAGKIIDLGRFEPNAISGAGEVVGAAAPTVKRDLEFDPHRRAALWSAGHLRGMGKLPGHLEGSAFGDGSEADGINDKGQVVGYSDSDHGFTAFVWQDGRFQELDGPPLGTRLTHWGGGRRAKYINSGGLILGEQEVLPPETGPASTGGPLTRVVLWRDGKMTELPLQPGFVTAQVFGLNGSGQALIEMEGAQSSRYGSYIWQDGKYTDLAQKTGFPYLEAWALNDAGQVVGRFEAANGEHAYIWQDGKAIDLNHRIPAHSGVTLEWARGINNRGQIVCEGTSDIDKVLILLTPAP